MPNDSPSPNQHLPVQSVCPHAVQGYRYCDSTPHPGPGRIRRAMILEAAYMDDGSDERSSCPNIPFARRPHRVRSKVFDLSYAISWCCRFQVYIASTVLSTALFSSLGKLIDVNDSLGCVPTCQVPPIVLHHSPSSYFTSYSSLEPCETFSSLYPFI